MRAHSAITILFVLLVFASVALLFSFRVEKTIAYDRASFVRAHASVTFGETVIQVEVADTPEKRAQGLSGREGLAQGRGLLFVFEKDDIHGFWMKDMRFAIDMVWLSREGVIVDMHQNIAPETYPSVFRSKGVARYVLEVPGGFMAQEGIEVGEKAILAIN